MDPRRNVELGHLLDICEEVRNTMTEYGSQESEKTEEQRRPQGDEGRQKVVNMKTIHGHQAQVHQVDQGDGKKVADRLALGKCRIQAVDDLHNKVEVAKDREKTPVPSWREKMT